MKWLPWGKETLLYLDIYIWQYLTKLHTHTSTSEHWWSSSKVYHLIHTSTQCWFPALVMYYGYASWYHWRKGTWDLCTIFATSCESIVISKQKVWNWRWERFSEESIISNMYTVHKCGSNCFTSAKSLNPQSLCLSRSVMSNSLQPHGL